MPHSWAVPYWETPSRRRQHRDFTLQEGGEILSGRGMAEVLSMKWNTGLLTVTHREDRRGFQSYQQRQKRDEHIGKNNLLPSRLWWGVCRPSGYALVPAESGHRWWQAFWATALLTYGHTWWTCDPKIRSQATKKPEGLRVPGHWPGS